MRCWEPFRSVSPGPGRRVRAIALRVPVGLRGRCVANRRCDCVVRYDIGTLRDSIAAPILESMGNSSSLANHLLIPIPPRAAPFPQPGALVGEHSDRGALVIVLKKPLGMKLGDVMAQMKLETSDIGISEQPVLRGG